MNLKKINTANNFRPAWWAKNKHIQTLFPVFFPKKLKLPLYRENITLPDGDFIQVDWIINKLEKKPLLILLHGLEGSSSSPYIQRLMKKAQECNYRAVCMHFRGCAGLPNKYERAYHAGDTEDLNYFIHHIKNKWNITENIFIAGFSLGGSVLLKWLDENPENNLIKSAAATSVPFELATTADTMNKGFSRIYQWWLLKSLKDSFIKKSNTIGVCIDESAIKSLKNFWEFDDKVTAKIHGFKNVNDYYAKSSPRQFLSKIKTPTLIIHSKDDPFMTPTCIPNMNELSNSITFELTEKGGHVGFVSGSIPFFPNYWLEDRILNYFNEYLR
ncbi:hydrolase [Silvanigrella sp.]|uniref:hydrolase n=1 Tax=Silvanigrella sp. TaxID=2024976 RepID=UPI0037CA55B8